MVDHSDLAESESNGSYSSCWKWKLRCFALFPNTSQPRTFRHLISQEENTSAESLLETPPTTGDNNSQSNDTRTQVDISKEHNKEISEKITKNTNIAENSHLNDSTTTTRACNSPTIESSKDEKNNSGSGFLHFLGLHFNKSETRHLDRTVNSDLNSTQSDIQHKVTIGNRKGTEESRYTKLPKFIPSPNSYTHFYRLQEGKIKNKASSKHLKGKSKSDNNLHRVSFHLHHLQASILTRSATRVENEYSEQNLNSVQIGDHEPIFLPWKQNNLSTTTQDKAHPHTHINLIPNNNSSDSSDTETTSWIQDTERQRTRSLERDSSFRISSITKKTFNLDEIRVSTSTKTVKPAEGFSGALKKIEYHPHRRVRKILNKREQEILLRHISPEVPPPVPVPLLGKRGEATIISDKTTNQIPKLAVEKDNKDRLNRFKILGIKSTDPPDRIISASGENSPRSPGGPPVSSPGVVSCPPSPPPRPPSTLKLRSRYEISSSDKAKLPTPSPTPTPTKTPASAFPFPPVMSSRADVVHSPTTHFQSLNRNPNPHHPENETIHVGGGGGVNNGISAAAMANSVEEARSSGFINKPTKGWLHADKLLTKEGVTYTVRYIGCHDVNTSMKSLDFDTRSLIAKECINQVCEAAGFKSIDRRRKVDRRLVKILGLRPRLEHAGSDVCLTITSTCLKLTSLETGAIVAVHDMPNISFASGGDVTMLDFVAYVAKDSVVGRACFVLECGSGLAQDVITTIGQAFELRFKEYLQKRPPPVPRASGKEDPEYYNDLPGKLPPEPEAKVLGTSSSSEGQKIRSTPTLTLVPTSEKDMAVNLIDFEAPTPPACGQLPPETTLESILLENKVTVENDVKEDVTSHDPFDMQSINDALKVPRLDIDEQRKELENEPWFHGVISRGTAEMLVVNDGDFLVRESQTTPHQYVLTGLQNGSAKHLLLIDPEGVVRTKDRAFESVSHLIRHHCDNSRPIISAESIVLLRTPVLRPTT